MIDLGKIITKLEAAGLVNKHATGMRGEFSIDKHSHLLTPNELTIWLHVLHESSGHDMDECTDLHKWNMEFIEEN